MLAFVLRPWFAAQALLTMVVREQVLVTGAWSRRLFRLEALAHRDSRVMSFIDRVEARLALAPFGSSVPTCPRSFFALPLRRYLTPLLRARSRPRCQP